MGIAILTTCLVIVGLIYAIIGFMVPFYVRDIRNDTRAMRAMVEKIASGR